jgi:Ca-activated chloride channel family protein
METTQQPLRVEITAHREFLASDTAGQKLFIMLKLRPTHEIAQTRPPTAVSLLIDTSGSMYEVVTGNPQPTGNVISVDGNQYREVQGGKTKIDMVIESLHHLIDSGRLDHNDKLCLIQFDDQASTLIGLTPATETQPLKQAIERLKQFSGGTCMGRGMEQALNILSSQPMTSKRALIFTDGQTFDELECQQLANQFALNGIPITALGVGEYNEDLLVNLSDTTAGRVYHVVAEKATGLQVAIENLPQTIFEEYLQAQQEVINNLAINVKTVKGVKLTRITKVYPEQAEIPLKQQPYHVGSAMGRDDTIFILEFDVDSRASSKVRVAQIGLTYDIPAQNRRGELPPQNVVVQFLAGQGASVATDQEVMGYVQQRNIAQLIDDATQIADQNPDLAEQKIETARRLTVKIGNQDMLNSLNESIEELRKTRKISAGTRKTVKMGSKSKTVKMSTSELNEGSSDEQIRQITGT